MKDMTNQKWKVGNHHSTVVSDTKIRNTNFPSPPNQRESGDDEPEYYGGYLICESIGNTETANLIASAPELLKALHLVQNHLLKKGIDYHSVDIWNVVDGAIKKALGK